MLRHVRAFLLRILSLQSWHCSCYEVEHAVRSSNVGSWWPKVVFSLVNSAYILLMTIITISIPASTKTAILVKTISFYYIIPFLITLCAYVRLAVYIRWVRQGVKD